MVSKTKHRFFKDGFQKLVQRWRKCIEVVVILWKYNYAALKIIDVGIFLSDFIKVSFPFILYLNGGKTYQPAIVINFDNATYSEIDTRELTFSPPLRRHEQCPFYCVTDHCTGVPISP